MSGQKAAQVTELLRTTGLVVLDPDDTEQMKRLAGLHDPAWQIVRDHHPDRVGTPTWEILAQSLRLLLDPTPPKPAEPTGLGAVVEDDKGQRWVRVGGSYAWERADTDEAGDHYVDSGHFADINAVRVLSEGVTA